MQTQTELCICFSKIEEPKLLLIGKVGPSSKIKKIFLQLSTWDGDLLSTLKVITFLA